MLIPVAQANLDTDRIIPKQYLKTVQRSGLGAYLFDEMRYHDTGFAGKQPQERQARQDFILNQPPYNQIHNNSQDGILITGANFGCGSSREHAVWSLMDFGIQVVIAPSFADIFFTNCSKNGLLTIELATAQVDSLIALALNNPGTQATVNLPQQQLQLADNRTYTFAIDPMRKKIFTEGLDDIAVTLQSVTRIKDFEQQHNRQQPWLRKGVS